MTSQIRSHFVVKNDENLALRTSQYDLMIILDSGLLFGPPFVSLLMRSDWWLTDGDDDNDALPLGDRLI